MAAPRYDTLSAARNGHQADHTAGHHPNQQPASAGDTGTRAETILPHGYTLADVEDITGVAVHLCRTYLRTVSEGHEAAQFAIIEHLYTATEPPTRDGLITVARRAIGQYLHDEERFRGIPRDRAPGGAWEDWDARCAVNFGRYWQWQSKPAPSPEDQVVERTALAQIWGRLTEPERRALSALAAADGDPNAAARALGYTYAGLQATVNRARSHFLRLWHQGETPSRKWRREFFSTEPHRRAALGRGPWLAELMRQRPHRSDCRCAKCHSARLVAAGRLGRRARSRHAARARAEAAGLAQAKG